MFQIGITVSHALWSCASTFSVFVLARFIGGLSKANVSLSMAIVTDVSNEKTRARGMVTKVFFNFIIWKIICVDVEVLEIFINSVFINVLFI